jgi:hypothetical protein
MAACPATGRPINDRGDHAMCLLYGGHPGRHSFDLDQYSG